MTREEYINHIDKLSLHLTYPELDHLHAINDSDAEQRAEIERLQNQLSTWKRRKDRLDKLYHGWTVEEVAEWEGL